jgi:hypothetical protein
LFAALHLIYQQSRSELVKSQKISEPLNVGGRGTIEEE